MRQARAEVLRSRPFHMALLDRQESGLRVGLLRVPQEAWLGLESRSGKSAVFRGGCRGSNRPGINNCYMEERSAEQREMGHA